MLKKLLQCFVAQPVRDEFMPDGNAQLILATLVSTCRFERMPTSRSSSTETP